MSDSDAPTETKPHRLGQLASTAICGNDITSSCLYVSALAISYAGRWAPVCLLLVAATLYLFRSIYAEVVGAMPLNGGAYNALLNTTSKYRASIAACLTVLSYMATAVISSNEAMHYLESMWEALPIIPATICLLAFFMVLTAIGITESAVVAIGIFLFHMTSMGLLLILGAFAIFTVGTDVLMQNLASPVPGGVAQALFFGFSAAMLGISGFESSANFVEEQQDGVFPKTLRNMWLAVTVLNPGMAILALALVPVAEVQQVYQTTLLSHMGDVAAGNWFSWLISVDAVLVLSGATLTSYVGVTGLVKRMTLDRCLPSFLLAESRFGTPHRIIILFFILSVSVLLITGGDLQSLAAVYTLSFLSVMALFAIGNLLLKVKRARLPRPIRASYLTVLVALTAVVIALLGNARLNKAYLIVFLEYLVPAVVIVTIMLMRDPILELIVFFVDEVRNKVRRQKHEAIKQNDRPTAAWWTRIARRVNQLDEKVHKLLDRIRAQQFVFFTRGDNVENLNRVMLYIKENEHTNRVKFVHVHQPQSELPPRLSEHIRFLDEVYPDIDIEFVAIEGEFTPELIEQLSEQWDIPTNLMFIGSPTGHLNYRVADLCGARLII
ncbi:APC family permease [Roseiconus nitratireducens]|uniref:APC family permease n=1 Tax=Roseiconus nitratireducens TaxID=2605748 RepID=A0A5M6CWZ1_9BACT|nr:APC family permease [Roseiconus nitratireducens]KAA5539731.1 APC family permease [Roseiconus nitratireducens]